MATQDSLAYQGSESPTSNKAKMGIQSNAVLSDHKIDEFRDIANNIGERLSKTGKQVTAWSKEHPVQAVLVGVSVGFLVGSVVRHAAMNGRK